ncbi:MAG: hypothetical protein AAF999_02755 [Pseudomonadota bacterium]
MMRFVIALALTSFGAPVLAEASKEESCRYQGQVMAAVQKARMDRVSKDKAASEILASGPTWPDEYSNAITPMVEQVYSMKRRDLRKNDLGALFEQQCLANWDQIQAMKKSMQSN